MSQPKTIKHIPYPNVTTLNHNESNVVHFVRLTHRWKAQIELSAFNHTRVNTRRPVKRHGQSHLVYVYTNPEPMRTLKVRPY
jgi:hypothetical protein